ncbi:MAG: AAA family ATPase [Asgard group archaeon]|nr:AAA family ATPase [Asgard group archaeon]
MELTEGILKFDALEELLFGEKIDLENNLDKVIHIYGEAGTGKTTLALQIARGFCLKNRKVIFIDTEGKVTGSKMQGIFGKKLLDESNQLLKLFIPTSFSEQQELIQKMEYFIQNQEIGTIIIDTITNLYRQERDLLKEDKRIFKQLAFQVALMHKIAKNNDFPVILFNQSTMPKSEDEDFLTSLKRERVNPVAKFIMDYWSDREIILLSHGYGKFEARIPREFEGRVKFNINSEGINPI